MLFIFLCFSLFSYFYVNIRCIFIIRFVFVAFLMYVNYFVDFC